MGKVTWTRMWIRLCFFKERKGKEREGEGKGRARTSQSQRCREFGWMKRWAESENEAFSSGSAPFFFFFFLDYKWYGSSEGKGKFKGNNAMHTWALMSFEKRGSREKGERRRRRRQLSRTQKATSLSRYKIQNTRYVYYFLGSFKVCKWHGHKLQNLKKKRKIRLLEIFKVFPKVNRAYLGPELKPSKPCQRKLCPSALTHAAISGQLLGFLLLFFFLFSL